MLRAFFIFGACCGADSSSVALRSLLVQRAVATVCFSARTCRDSVSAQYLSAFCDLHIEEYHGISLSLFNLGWSEYLRTMLRASPEIVTVQSVLKKHRGLSPNNPYLQPSFMTRPQEIQPSVLAERVMRSARLIAKEWTEDMQLMRAENNEVWQRRLGKVSGLGAAEAAERLPVFAIDQDANADSPYRGGNYDLLQALITREAVGATVHELSLLPSRTAEARLLASAAEDAFEGELKLHAAEAFLASLLQLPFALEERIDEEGGLTDRFKVVEELLERREQLALSWAVDLSHIDEDLLSLKCEWLDEHLQ